MGSYQKFDPATQARWAPPRVGDAGGGQCHFLRLCRKFSFEAIYGMISLHDPGDVLREKDDGDQLQRCALPPRSHSSGGPLVCAYPLSTRHVEELMEERGVEGDHSTMNRWVIRYSPQLEEAIHRRTLLLDSGVLC